MISKIYGILRTIQQILFSFDDRVTSWKEAENRTSGYGASVILKKVRSSYLDSQKKKNSYERDSVVLNDKRLNWPLVGMILWFAKNIDTEVRVLDFGGSFASAYFQNSQILTGLNIRWMVIEQNSFVTAATQLVKNSDILFYEKVEICLDNEKPNFAHFGSSLQYLERPYEILKLIESSQIKILILDRIPIHTGNEDIVAVQKVPKEIYDASYPAWIFSESKLKKFLSKNWILLSEFDSIGGYSRTLKQKKFKWQGSIFISRKHNTESRIFTELE